MSNVGVSVALNITAHKRRFAALVQSSPDSPYKLISGYCDIGGTALRYAHPAAEFLVTACREITEELLVCRPARSHLSAVPVHVRPSYLAGTSETSKIIVDGQSLEAAFYLDRRYRCGQIVFSFNLDLSGSDYTLLHAEDSYCAENRRLETALHPRGLILAELAPDGCFLGDFFWLREGKLVQIARNTKIRLSEVFTTCSGNPGIIEHGAVSISAYLLNQRRRGGSR